MENKILKISSLILAVTIFAAAAMMGDFSDYLMAKTGRNGLPGRPAGGTQEAMSGSPDSVAQEAMPEGPAGGTQEAMSGNPNSAAQEAMPEGQGAGNQDSAAQDGMSELQKLQYDTQQAKETEEIAFQQQLRIELPQGMSLEEVEIENDYVTQTIFIQIPDVGKDYFSQHPLLGSSSHINDLYMENGRIEITMDAVYEVDSSVEDGYLYLDFISPGELYDKVVVIDAGHGGGAPGAIKQGITEKDINLAIVRELKELLDNSDEDIRAYYTRTEDENPSFEQRAQLGEKAGASLFISIHSNSSEDGRMSEYNGTEVMYDQEKSQEGLSSKHLAQICLEETTAATGSKSNGITYGNSIYVVRHSQVPAALIEVGYMTNQKELEQLASPSYQKQAAQGIYHAILRALEEGY